MTGDTRTQENFCHFWRVVLIWAPLRKVGKWFRRQGETIWLSLFLSCLGIILLSLVLWLGIGYWGVIGWWAMLLAPLTVVAVISGVFGGLLLLGWIIDPTGLTTTIKRRRARRTMSQSAREAPQPGHSGFINFFILIG